MCPLGTYSQANSTSCTKCEGGFQCPNTQYTSRVACAAGMFSYIGSTHCFYCPVGKSCVQATVVTGLIQVGEPIIQTCGPGSYSDEGVVTCTQCPVG